MNGPRAQSDGGLRVALESHLPRSLPVGSRVAVFCFGHCFHPTLAVRGLQLLVDGVAHDPGATRMPRRDLYDWLHGAGEDPAGHSYRSGFWVTLPVCAPPVAGVIDIAAAIRLADGSHWRRPLGQIAVTATERPAWPDAGVNADTIAVCMATFDPEPALLRAQIESLRAQTEERWICVISDGGSAPERFATLLEQVGEDKRFVISRAEQRLTPWRNFERALCLVPRDVGMVALSDQDDRWCPDKLATLRAALGSRTLVYSDQRLVSAEGQVLRESLWQGRRRDHSNLASLLMANSVPGASMLFRRELLDDALPFPDAPGDQYHDHWLALVALAGGEIGFVDRPLYDYVQHRAAVMGDLAGPHAQAQARRRRRRSMGWRSAYFGGFVGRAVMARTLLLRYDRRLPARKRRALSWFIAADRTPGAFAWLALRPLRRVIGRDETLGGELALAGGVAWRWLILLAVGGARRPSRRPFDASFPDPPQFEQPRLRRWRTAA